LIAKPGLIVELGTRGAESTKAILAASSFYSAVLLSIDINPCDDIELPQNIQYNWEFIQADDVEFGSKNFISWCKFKGLDPVIDVLFIDTSHEYEHTKNEIGVWFQYLSKNGGVLFHDTNMGKIYRRLDNSLGLGWDNNRGVMKAIEEYLGKTFDETKSFVDVEQDWLIRHYPYSSGLTLMNKLNLSSLMD